MNMTGGGLHLPDAIGPGARDEETVDADWDTHDEMELELELMGFSPHPKPRHQCPTLTADVLNTPNSQTYTTVYQQIQAWHNYAVDTLGRIKSVQVQLKHSMVEIARLVREGAPKTIEGKKVTKEQLNDMVEAHPGYRERKLENQKWEQKKLMLQPKCDSWEKDLKLMSRQVEIRRQDWESGDGGKGAPPSRDR